MIMNHNIFNRYIDVSLRNKISTTRNYFRSRMIAETTALAIA